MNNVKILEDFEYEVFNNFSVKMNPNTKYDYFSKLVQFKKFIGGKNFVDVDKYDCEKFMVFVKKTYAKSTSEKVYSYLHSYFNYLNKEKHIKINPFRSIEKPTVTRIKNKDDVLNIEEINKLLSIVPKLKLRDGAIIVCLITTGCLLNELVNLKWKDIHKDPGGEVYIKLGKGRKERSMLIHPYLLFTLEEYRASLGLGENIDNCDSFIFTTQKSDFITDRNVRIIVRKALDMAELPHYSARDFRHSYAAINLMFGLDEVELKNKLGWSDKHYAQRYKYVLNFMSDGKVDNIIEF
ncbi:tyrosine-type recombinase/integrase [Metaclostridioides mangenotii]|uniref:tyrosine-type recombinase/integrase n=1 Tax=Metaclostridioides mangenotii TaxID=1540 RepID=UPI0004889E48|nr:tyrosine-type recombinase/integrase [Clostridioides mangenotii]